MRALALGPRHLFGVVAAAFALHGHVLQTAHGQAPIFTEGQGERQLAGFQWDTLWAFGGPGDTLLASATTLVPDDRGGLFFTDARSFKVHHLDSNGRLLWSWGREGGGPGEVRVAMAMALERDAGVVLVDPGNRRIVRIDRDGRLVGEVPLRIDAGWVFDVVVLSSGTYVMQTSGSDPWVLVDSTGMQIGVADAPQGLADFTVPQRAGSIVKWKDEQWAFGFETANGWFTFDREVSALGSPYVEHTDVLPANATQPPPGTVPSGYSLSVRGDTLAVLFMGRTRARSRLIDRYDMHSGSYLDSLILPMPAKAASVGPQGQVFVVTYDEFPTVMAPASRTPSF